MDFDILPVFSSQLIPVLRNFDNVTTSFHPLIVFFFYLLFYSSLASSFSFLTFFSLPLCFLLLISALSTFSSSLSLFSLFSFLAFTFSFLVLLHSTLTFYPSVFTFHLSLSTHHFLHFTFHFSLSTLNLKLSHFLTLNLKYLYHSMYTERGKSHGIYSPFIARMPEK